MTENQLLIITVTLFAINALICFVTNYWFIGIINAVAVAFYGLPLVAGGFDEE